MTIGRDDSAQRTSIDELERENTGSDFGDTDDPALPGIKRRRAVEPWNRGGKTGEMSGDTAHDDNAENPDELSEEEEAERSALDAEFAGSVDDDSDEDSEARLRTR